MKGDSPVKNTGNELWVYSAQFSCWLQVEGLWEAKHRSIWPRSWFTRSDWPLVCGWMVSLQKCGTNWGFLLETTSSGRPWILKTWSMITQAVSLAEGSLGRATKWTALEKRSTTVRITVLPLDRGRPVTKSRSICDQGREGMRRGCNRPADGKLEDLFWAQTEQAPTNRRISSVMAGHQNRWQMAASYLLTPGWHWVWKNDPTGEWQCGLNQEQKADGGVIRGELRLQPGLVWRDPQFPMWPLPLHSPEAK